MIAEMTVLPNKMKWARRWFLLASIVLSQTLMLLSSCASIENALDSFTIVFLDKHTLKVTGEIDQVTSEIFIEVLDSNPDVRKIVITSGGGDVAYSIPIAERIYDRGIIIEVEKYAMSSAFNYFVLAAKETIINENSILGYHGSANTSASWLVKPLLRKVLVDEKEFLIKIGRHENFFYDLENDFEKILIKNEADFDFNFYMIGKSFFEKYNVAVSETSYFPKTQDDLDALVEQILKEK
ncbi:MAG: hypothetical protein HN368_07710, partial [Spirochaetales bacterium]|nr:hypothetical protein [Spirochaetales bacterium]